MRREELKRAILHGLTVIAIAITMSASANGQQSPSTQFRTGDDTKSTQPQQAQPQQAQTQQAETNSAADPYFKDVYRHFYTTYKLGPADEVAIRVVGQPDYTLEKAQVSPVGRLYHPLIGDIEVVGLTIDQATERLTIEFSQFIREPRVSLSLLAANSSLVGVLGDVARPGILVMARPMTLLDAISASGGVTDLGSQSNITLVRRSGDGTMRTTKVNIKRVLEGKASAEDNVTLQAGDTLIVHGNTKKKIGLALSTFGFGRFLDFLSRRY